MQTPDQELVARFLTDGDEEAFRLLFRRQTPRLYALALRLLAGRRAEAEDAVQEAWQRAAARLARFEWRSAFSTWLASILTNVVRERLRARRSDWLTPEDEAALAAPATSPASKVDLECAIAELPDGYREVLVLHDIEGYTHDEIAQQLDIMPGTSKSQLSRARRALRARLAPFTTEADSHA